LLYAFSALNFTDWWTESSSARRGDRLKGLVDRGQLGPFANAWGHPAYRLPPRGQPDGRGPLPRGARVAARVHQDARVLGGKNPHLQSFLVGGMATPVDPDSQSALNIHTIAQLKAFVANARDFV